MWKVLDGRGCLTRKMRKIKREDILLLHLKILLSGLNDYFMSLYVQILLLNHTETAEGICLKFGITTRHHAWPYRGGGGLGVQPPSRDTDKSNYFFKFHYKYNAYYSQLIRTRTVPKTTAAGPHPSNEVSIGVNIVVTC